MSPHPAPSRVFAVDAESDGLYGEVWAVGAVVLDHGTEIDRFAAMIDPAVHVTTEWVRRHVVPVVDLPLLDDRRELLERFWQFWLTHRESAICVADFGAPVEAHMFRACVEGNAERAMLAPYPLHELGTALLLAGVDPDIDRRVFAHRPDLVSHDPVDDALLTGLCWERAIALVVNASRPRASTEFGGNEDSQRES